MTAVRPTLEVLVGLPGSGKSGRAYCAKKDGDFVYSTDAYIEDAARAAGKTYDDVFPSVFEEATRAMDHGLGQAINERRNICWDQTNLSKRKRTSILARIPSDYVKICYCILPPRNEREEEELARRLASRLGKTIPAHVLGAMRKSYVLPAIDEGLDYIVFADMSGKVLEVIRNG